MGVQGGLARAVASYACGWGSTTDGTYSHAVAGGYTHGYQSFPASAGVANADYSNALGQGAVARFRGQTVLGTYNALDHPEASILSDPPFAFDPQPTDPVFVIGNGWVNPEDWTDQHRSTAFTVSYQGDAKILGGLTVDGNRTAHGDLVTGAHTKSTFKQDVSVQGVLRVQKAGDIDMGAFTAGPLP